MGTAFLSAALPSNPAFGANSETISLRDNGSIPAWLVAGPFGSNTNHSGLQQDFLTAKGGEATAVGEEGPAGGSENSPLHWKLAFSDGDGMMNFHEALAISRYAPRTAYAFCQLQSAAEKKVVFAIRHNEGCRLWLNGELIVDRPDRGGPDPVTRNYPATLKAGANRLLCKVEQVAGDWGFHLAVRDDQKKAAPGVSATLNTPLGIKGRIVSITYDTLPLVKKTSQGDRWMLQATIQSGGLKGVFMEARCPGWKDKPFNKVGDLPLGIHKVELEIPPVNAGDAVQIETQSSGMALVSPQTKIPPPRQWTIYLVQHTHTDIGYTRPQTEILPEHLRYIDYALDYCDLTDNYPDDARFRWTCETSWAPREYLKRRPAAQVARLKKRVQEGRIEIAGMLLNMAETATESSLAASFQSLREVKQELGASIVTAMQNDVNGAGWCLVDYFSDLGIRYLTMGINKTRSLLPFDRPTTFWWESPSGKRVLAYRSDHYMTANFWQINQGTLDKFRPGVVGYLRSLSEREYPFPRIAVQYSGYFTDNSPPSTVGSDVVKQWNDTYAWPRLRQATAHEFLEYVAQEEAQKLPVYRAAWPDWWTDGFGSAARETAASRDTHVATQISSGLLAMSALLGTPVTPQAIRRINEIQDDLMFYDEHTYGAAESVDDPLAENTQVQWGEKGSYAWNAVKNSNLLREEAFGLVQDFVPRSTVPVIAVFNTLNWERSGLVRIFIDHEILPADKAFEIIDADSNKPVPAQPLTSRAEGGYWAIWCPSVPPMGCKTFQVRLKNEKRAPISSLEATTRILENGYYRLAIDPDKAAIKSLVDKETGRDLVDSAAPWQLGQCLYETLPTREFNREAFKRTPVRQVKVQAGAQGAIWKSLNFTGELDGCADKNGFKMEIRLYETEKRIELNFSLRKKPVTTPEAVYVAFPFQGSQSQLVYEGQGGLVVPGAGQIPGSATDWQTVQNFLAVRQAGSQVILVCNEVPLVQLGGLNLGLWQPYTHINQPHVYSWVMNNYWFTNFRASQEGEFRWQYFLTSTQDSGNRPPVQFGWGSRVPLAARVFPPGPNTPNRQAASFSTLSTSLPNVLLVEARPALSGQGVVLHIREMEGQDTTVRPKHVQCLRAIQGADEVNAIEEVLHEDIDRLTLKPFETKFIRLKF
jgi:hypothetical protein